MDWKKIITIILGICGSAGTIVGILALNDKWSNEPALGQVRQEVIYEIAKNRDIMKQQLKMEEFVLRNEILRLEADDELAPLYLQQNLENMQELLKEMDSDVE